MTDDEWINYQLAAKRYDKYRIPISDELSFAAYRELSSYRTLLTREVLTAIIDTRKPSYMIADEILEYLGKG